MQVPVRLFLVMRSSLSAGILLAVGASTFVLSATPFLLDLVAEEYDIGLAAASLIGVFQLGGFVVGSWGSGRWLRPRRRVFVAALLLAIAANLLSVALPPFALLIALRFASGLSLGLISWFAWVQVFGDDTRMGDIAVIGPVAGVAASPLIAVAADRSGAAGVFALLTALSLIPLAFNRGSGATDRLPPQRRRSAPIPVARILLGVLGLFTVGGSAVFQYAVVLGKGRLDLDPAVIAVIFSANAVAGIPATRWPWRRGLPGPWLLVTAACAVTMTVTTAAPVFAAAIVVWGFAFWMGVPGVFTVLAQRSVHPAERAGDAQAVMAAGRVVGPFLGGAVLDGMGATALGLIGGLLMAAAGLAVFAVRTRVPARTDSVSIGAA